ncbi:hypothetical protein KGF57_000380 [Candida theae]|uniref:TEA domain-containing protein n=1 Tax=Candida theae TaxID=1198502 RepID=A0AAD5G0N9_9ASCO|nr:uncharacterized protein KGF57_000380 [Candida theae]KAI5967437.1 hypothetical protein KGF57_000380 [Candida theae]
MTNQPPPSIVLEHAPPETPRTKSAQNNASGIPQGLNKLSTPSFPFGLSFSPTFNFNTPNGISPTRFFSPLKATENITKAEQGNTTPASKDHYKFLASLNSISHTADAGHQSSALEIKSNVTKNNGGNEEKEEDEDEDIWSSLNATSQNQSNLTSIHESDNEAGKCDFAEGDLKMFQTPAKKSASGSKLNQLPPNVVSDVSAQGIYTRDTPLSTYANHVVKKRKIDSHITDTPNNRIATRIDSTMESPLSVRRLSNANSTTSSAASDVWSLELDEILIKSFHKYHKFKSSDVSNESTILKKTSQNKVISRMIFNRTGILRTSKQISSRIFRLTKAGRLTKETKTPQTVASTSELEDFMRTPLEELVNGQQLPDSAHSDALIDNELNMLLTSSPLEDVFEAVSFYGLVPRDFMMRFRSNHQTLTFTQLRKQTTRDNKISEKLDPLTLRALKSQNASILMYSHDLNLQIRDMETSTPLPRSWTPNSTNTTNLHGSCFESTMSIEVLCKGSATPPMLTWHSSLEVFKGDKKLLRVTDMINGYRNEDEKSYTLHIPFVKSFFTGYINYLINGSTISSEEDIKVVQFIYNNVDESNSKLDLQKSNVHAYIIHNFHVNGTRGETSVKIVETKSIRQGTESDDNETVVADSSPLGRHSSTPQSTSKMRERESPAKLKIDINKANQNHNLLSGPMTAPVYNSKVNNQFNGQGLGDSQGSKRLNLVNGVPPSAPPPQSLQQQPVDSFAFYRVTSQNSLSSSQRIHFDAGANNTNMNPMQPRGYESNGVRVGVSSLGTQQPTTLGNPYNPQTQNVLQQFPSRTLYSQQQFPQMSFHLQQHGGVKNHAPSAHSSTPGISFAANYQNVPVQQHQSHQPGQHVSNQPLPNTTNIANIQPKQNSRFQTVHTHSNQQNKAKEITFGPILGYDPSKDAKITRAQTKPSNQGRGIHNFPLNEPVMYKPKK